MNQVRNWKKVILTALLGTLLFTVAGKGTGVVLGQEAPGESFAELQEKAAAARETNDLETAIGFYERALKISPYWMEGLWYNATLNYELDRYEAARDGFRRFVELDKKVGAAWALLGLCEFQTKEYEQALLHLQLAIDLGIGKNKQFGYVTLYHSSILLNYVGEFEAAQNMLSNMALSYADSPSIIEAVGISILRLKALPAELPPDKRDAVILAGKAGVAWAVNKFEEAGSFYSQLVARYPQMPHVHYAQGVYFLRKDPILAVKEFETELEITPDHEPALLQLAFEYLKQGDPAKALPYAQRAAELRPSSFVAHNALGRAYLDSGDIEQAIVELEKGASLAPDSPEMYFSLARAYRRAGRREDAQKARAKFLELDGVRRGEDDGSPNSGSGSQEP